MSRFGSVLKNHPSRLKALKIAAGLATGLLLGSQLPLPVLLVVSIGILAVAAFRRYRRWVTRGAMMIALVLATVLPSGNPAPALAGTDADSETPVVQACGFLCSVGAGLVAMALWKGGEWVAENCSFSSNPPGHADGYCPIHSELTCSD